MATDVEEILQRMGLSSHINAFRAEKITKDIVSLLSEYEFRCLGIVDRSTIVKLRTECQLYGRHTPIKKTSTREFIIPEETIKGLLDCGFSVSDVGNLLSVSDSTIYRRMRQFNISKYDFTEMNDAELDAAVEETLQEFPHSGECMIKQILAQKNILVQRSRLRECLHRIDVNGIHDRSRRRLHRRIYSVPCPNHLWHIDTNHKLIRWHFIIIGGIDGFSRLVTFLECRDNNKANTLLQCFLQGVQEYGLPLRVRSDKGLENSKIADFMIAARGLGRGSMITGKSTHNQRIERLWRDVYEGVLSFYYDLFYFMEDEGLLNILDDIDMYALHHVYLEKICLKLSLWKNAWAKHRLRTVGSSPLRLFTAGMMNSPAEPSLVDIDTYGVDGPLFEDTFAENSRPVFASPNINITQDCINELNEQCPRTWVSNNHGIDIYVKARQIIKIFNQDDRL